jgi:hypothetical protein
VSVRAEQTARQPKSKLKMKTRNLLITLCVAALASTNVLAVDGLLSPKAAGQQTKTVRGYNSDPNLADTGLASAPPRVVESQTKTVPGKSKEVTPSLMCVRHMSGTPKMIGACADSAGGSMSCCSGATK